MILSEKIILLRKQNGWSQEEPAEKLGISRQSVSKWKSTASLPDLDKVIKMSAIFNVSTDYLLKDEIEEIEYAKTDNPNEKNTAYSVSLKEANSFLQAAKGRSFKTALASSLFLASPICLILLGGLSSSTRVSLSARAAGLGGIVILLLFIAAAITLLLLGRMQFEKYGHLINREISLEYGAEGMIKMKRETFKPIRQRCTIIGSILLIFCPLPIILDCVFQPAHSAEFIMVLCLCLMLFLISCSVFLLIWTSCMNRSFQQLLHQPSNSAQNKRTPISRIYWCIVTAVFLAALLLLLSATDRNAAIALLIWPVAGVLFPAVKGIVDRSGK